MRRAAPAAALAAALLLLGGVAAAQEQEPPPHAEDAEADDALDIEVRAEGVADLDQRAASSRQVEQRLLLTQPRRSAEDLLRFTPGLLVVQHGSEGKGHQLFLRGFDAVHGTDVEVTLEGIPLNEASQIHGHGYLDLNFMIPEVVRSVEAIKGPLQLTQGPFATAGSARFRLGVEEGLRGWTTGYQAGTTGRHRVYTVYAPRGRSASTFAAAEAMRDAGFGQNRSTERVSALSQWRLADGSGGRLEVLGAAYASRFGLPGALRAADVDAGTIGFYDAWRDDTAGHSLRGLAALRFEDADADADLRLMAWAGWRELELVEDFTGYLLDPEAGDRRQQRQHTRSLGGRVSGARYVGLWTLRAGGTAQVDLGDQGEAGVDADHEPLEVRRDLAYTTSHAAAWAGVEWRPLERLRLEAGLRGDLIRIAATDHLQDAPSPAYDAFPHLAPRASASWTAGEGLTLYAAGGRGLRPPEARAVVPGRGTAENEEVDRFQGGAARITSSTGVEAGARWRPAAGVEVTASGFGTWIARESIFDHLSGLNLEVNPTRRLGVEASAAWEPRPWLHLRVDGTAVQARFVESGGPVPGAPALMGSAEVEITHPAGWRVGTRALALAPRPLPHGATTSALFTWDAAAGYRWGSLDLSLEVENVLNRDWREGEYHYASWWDRATPRSSLPALHYVAGTPLNARLGVAWTF